MTHKEELSTSISSQIKRMIASYLLAQSVAFSMEPLPEGRYSIRVSAEVVPRLQAEIGRVLERGIVDDDDLMAWFRYKGALISYVEQKPGYTAEYHYRYQTAGMAGARKFDIRDMTPFAEEHDHGATIKRAFDLGELHPHAPFLQEPDYEVWECC